MEAVTDITKREPARNTTRTTTTRTAIRAIRVTRLSMSLRKAIKDIMIKRSTSRSTTRKWVKRRRITKKLDIMTRRITVRRVRKTQNLAKRASIKKDIVRRENIVSSRRMNMRRNKIFMTNTMRMEEVKNTVVGMKNMRGRKVVMKRKALCMQDTTRVIMVRKRNTREVTIIMKRKVINRQKGTIVITTMMRNMAIKEDMHQDTNGLNRIIIDETQRNLLLYNHRKRFTYVYFVENFTDRIKLDVWSDIEWCESYTLNLLKRLVMTTIILFFVEQHGIQTCRKIFTIM